MDLKNPTRTESLLANIAGYTGVPVPDMKNATRSERLLKEILDNGGGGGGGDVTKEYVDNAIANAVDDIDEDISALSNTVEGKVDKVNGKSLSTNDYADADKALVQDSPITVTSTASPISTANGKPRAITIYGKSEIVDGAIKSAGEGYAVVDLGTLDYSYIAVQERYYATGITSLIKPPATDNIKANCLSSIYQVVALNELLQTPYPNMVIAIGDTGNISIRNTAYTDPVAFKTAMSGVLLCYELADPSQSNAIAIKTDNGTGINSTMATFSTGTPLYGVSADIRDVMQWDGSSGEVTKKCNKVRLADLTWAAYETGGFGASLNDSRTGIIALICSKYPYDNSVTFTWESFNNYDNKTLYRSTGKAVYIKDTDYTSLSDFVNSLGDAELVYELATPTKIPLTTTELASLSALKTYSPQTAITINDNPEFEVEAYANTANGQVISDMQPTRSPLLTLSASGWTNNAQTVTYKHDIGKRNSIDVEPTSIKAWTAAGILATAETASTITFECDTTPTADLSFRVTSMEVR